MTHLRGGRVGTNVPRMSPFASTTDLAVLVPLVSS
jgi:hypothetical protein